MFKKKARDVLYSNHWSQLTSLTKSRNLEIKKGLRKRKEAEKRRIAALLRGR
jgi:hypothetical protein